MSHQPLREDKTCQNCRAVVQHNYCPNCGQKNTETRQSFVHLFTHFFEDFTHYDNAFWKTMRSLLFRPAKLTREYLAGKRQTYVPPVRLYIFLSFVTFLVIGYTTSTALKKNKEAIAEERLVSVKATGTVDKDSVFFGKFKTLKELDSAELAKPLSQRKGYLEMKFARKMVLLHKRYGNNVEDFMVDAILAGIKSLPKVLFIYLPTFAFLLWIFHGKKRWYYFDHGIFTLHYFSFILLTLTMASIIGNTWTAFFPKSDISGWFFVICLTWWFVYFFVAHRRMYNESRTVSILKSLALFLVNTALVAFLMAAAVMYVILTL